MTHLSFDSTFTNLIDVNAEVKQIVNGCQFTEGPIWVLTKVLFFRYSKCALLLG